MKTESHHGREKLCKQHNIGTYSTCPAPRGLTHLGKEGRYTNDYRAGNTWSILGDPQARMCHVGVLKWAYWKHIVVFCGLQPKDNVSHQLKHTRHRLMEHILIVLKSRWSLQNEVSKKTSCSSSRMRRTEEKGGGWPFCGEPINWIKGDYYSPADVKAYRTFWMTRDVIHIPSSFIKNSRVAQKGQVQIGFVYNLHVKVG